MTIKVPATSANMGPGFDTLGIGINLTNKVNIKRSKYFSISIKGEGEDKPKLKKNNAFINIFYELYKKMTGEKDKFRFEFDNAIPLSRGLGSSSAVIIAAMAAAYEAANAKISKDKLLNKALFYESHPDNVAPAVFGGFTVSVVENKKVYMQKKVMPDYLKAVMVIPGRSMSTVYSRGRLPKSYSVNKTVFNVSRSSLLSAAIFNEKWDFLKVASRDMIHQDQRMKSMPELFSVQKKALENGALMSTLSGSGSSFFNMAHIDDAKKLKEVLSLKFPSFRVEIFDFNNDGLEILV